MNIDKLLKEAYEEVKQEIADGTLKLGEARAFKVNPKYTHFAVDKATGKIITGWEYKDLDPQSIATYVKGDLKDMERKPSDVTIKTVGSLKAKGIDAFNWSSWNKENQQSNEDTVIKTPDGTLATATPLQKQQIQKTKDTVKTVKTGAVVMEEAADEPTDGEQEEPAEESGNISDKLSSLISQAIDAAGGVISSTEDKKMETALGKVIKNLTAAQDALSKVSEHEGKLSEKVEAETAKNLEKYTKDFLKGLRKYTKDDALINKFRRTYDPLVAAAMKAEKPVDEIVKTAWGHFTLNENKK